MSRAFLASMLTMIAGAGVEMPPGLAREPSRRERLAALLDNANERLAEQYGVRIPRPAPAPVKVDVRVTRQQRRALERRAAKG